MLCRDFGDELIREAMEHGGFDEQPHCPDIERYHTPIAEVKRLVSCDICS